MMASWAEIVLGRWAEEDRRAAAGATPCCGRRDFVVLYEEDGRARVRCRHCFVDSTVKAAR